MYYEFTKPIPLFDNVTFQVIISDNKEKVEKRLEDTFEYLFAHCAKSYVKRKGVNCKSICIVLNPVFSKGELDKITPGVVAHECIHAKNSLFEEIGHDHFCPAGKDEPEAYLMMWMLDTSWNFFQACMDKEAKLKEKDNEPKK